MDGLYKSIFCSFKWTINLQSGVFEGTDIVHLEKKYLKLSTVWPEFTLCLQHRLHMRTCDNMGMEICQWYEFARQFSPPTHPEKMMAHVCLDPNLILIF